MVDGVEEERPVMSKSPTIFKLEGEVSFEFLDFSFKNVDFNFFVSLSFFIRREGGEGKGLKNKEGLTEFF